MASAPQVLVTGMLQLGLFAITDNRNNPALQGTQALVIGILVVIIGVSLGMNTGYAINPSRDLPPRFFTFIAGWGIKVFRYCPAQPIPASFCGSPACRGVGVLCEAAQESPAELPGGPQCPPSPALKQSLCLD